MAIQLTYKVVNKVIMFVWTLPNEEIQSRPVWDRGTPVKEAP